MRRIWQVAYLVLFGLVIGSFGIAWCLDKLNVPVTEELGLEKNRSYLEGKTYANFPEPTIASFASGEFQEGVENFVADRFPARDEILLANAAWQRSLIGTSAAVFGYGVYPTFYGSDYVYDLPRDEVVQILDSATADTEQAYERAARAYRSFAERHPEIDCYFYEVDRMSSSTRNPTHGLVGPSVDTEFLDRHFFGLLGDRITCIDGSFTDTDALTEAFFRTDHHWNGTAAYGEYVRMLEVMLPGTEPAEVVERVTWSDIAFFGSTARSGLCLSNASDHVSDCLVDVNGYVVVADGKERPSDFLQHSESYAAGDVGKDRFTNRYAEYFHGDYGLIEINNPSAQTDEALLIVGDSFDNAVDRYFAANYATVYVYDPRHADFGVEELLADQGVDDVLFLMGSTVFPLEDNWSKLE